jgi:hypothetical protein
LLPKEAEKLTGALKLFALGSEMEAEKKFPKLKEMSDRSKLNDRFSFLKKREEVPGTIAYEAKQKSERDAKRQGLTTEITRLIEERDYWRGKAARGEISQAPFAQADANRQKNISNKQEELNRFNIPLPPVRPQDLTVALETTNAEIKAMMDNAGAAISAAIEATGPQLTENAKTFGAIVAAQIAVAFVNAHIPPISVEVKNTPGPDRGTNGS